MRDTFCLCTNMPTGEDDYSVWKRQALSSMGIRYLRSGFHWNDYESKSPASYFEEYDLAVDTAKANGQDFIGLFGGSSPPDDLEAFAKIIYETVSHFKGRVGRWEIWNEQNAGYRFWKPMPEGDPDAYGSLLKAAYTAAKDADPGCEVAFGGTFFPDQMLPGSISFIEDVYKFHPDIGQYYDVMAFHPYPTYPPSVAPEYEDLTLLWQEVPILKMISSLRELMTKHGNGEKKIWITEAGWPTWGDITYQNQAQYLVRSFILAISAGVKVYCWYNFQDGTNPEDFPPEDAFGLFENKGTGKPSSIAYGVLYEQLGDTFFCRDLKEELGLSDDEYGYFFKGKNGDKSVMVIWNSREGQASTITIQFERGTKIFIVEMLGNKTSIEIESDYLDIRIKNDPVYLILNYSYP